MSKSKLENRFIIGNQPEFFYIGQIMQRGKDFDTFVLISSGKNLVNMNYILLKLQFWGLVEVDRKWKEVNLHGKNIPSLEVTLEKIPALKSIREELRR